MKQKYVKRLGGLAVALTLGTGLALSAGVPAMAADACGSSGFALVRNSTQTVVQSAAAAVGSIPKCAGVQSRAVRYVVYSPNYVYGPMNSVSSTATNTGGTSVGGDGYRAKYNNPSVWSGWFSV